ncbi:hypothetical protein AAMO2058_000823100 [Amorphochlora amoebiformis]
MALDRFVIGRLPSLQDLVILVATTGQGEPPKNMAKNWKFLLRKSLPTNSLEGLRIGVFGLGDSAYKKYNWMGRLVYRRLAQLGAKPVNTLDEGLGNDQDPAGQDTKFVPWVSKILDVFAPIDPNGPPLPDLPPPTLNLSYNTPLQDAHEPPKNDIDQRLLARSLFLRERDSGEEDAYVMATVQSNERVVRAGVNTSEVRVIRVAVDEGVKYEAGDVLYLLPDQPSSRVHSLCRRLGVSRNTNVTFSRANTSHEWNPRTVGLMDLIQSTLDVNSASAGRWFIELMAYYATTTREADKLKYFCSREGSEELYEYNKREKRTVLELLSEFPSVHLPLERFLESCPVLMPRAFSIACSPHTKIQTSDKPNPALPHSRKTIEICAKVVRSVTPWGRHREGLCTGWLRNVSVGTRVAVRVEKGKFKIPPNEQKPLILVGPGTGFAPVKSLVEDRIANAKATGEWPPAPMAIFFGCRHRDKDYIYREEMEMWENNGVFTRGGGIFRAFSRDQREKRYVTDEIERQGALLWDMLEKGASIYVSGSAKSMPDDVFRSFRNVIATHGKKSLLEASRLLLSLEQKGRYVSETW